MFRQPAPPPIVNKDSSSLADEASPTRSWRVVGADGSTTDFDPGPTHEGPIVEVAVEEVATAPEQEIAWREHDTEGEEESRVEPTLLRDSLDLLASKIGSRDTSTTRQNIGMPRANTELSSMLDDHETPREGGERQPSLGTSKVSRQGSDMIAGFGATAAGGIGLPSSQNGPTQAIEQPTPDAEPKLAPSRRFSPPTARSGLSQAFGPAGPASLLTAQNSRPCRDIDARLARIIDTWPDLPHAVQQAMTAMVEAVCKER